MASHSIEELRAAIGRARRRRNLILHARQVGWSLATIVGLFIVCVTLEMVLPSAMFTRVLLVCLFAAAAGAVIRQHVRAVRRFAGDDQRLAHYLDDRLPDLEQRLITSVDAHDRQGESGPSGLVEALWQDTAARLRDRNIEQVNTFRPAGVAAGVSLVLVCILSVALWESARFSDAARRFIRPWSIPAAGTAPSAGIEVSPGDILIRRGSDVAVSVKTTEAPQENVFLFLQGPAGGWGRIRMQAEGAPPEYMHYLSGVQTDITYYVDAGDKRSRQFRIRVFDLIRIESIDVAYEYPAHTGIENKTEKNSGDITAPEGTRVRLHITFDRPVQRGVLKFGDGATLDLTPAENAATASFVVETDGTYVVDAQDGEGRKVENPTEYVVRSIPDSPPEVVVTLPGRDLEVMALEEVTIDASAKDDYGLTTFTLNYSVAGSAEQQVPFLEARQTGVPTAVDGRTTIYLEDLQLAPGDFVTYYLTAADNNGIGGPSEVISDIYFLEVIRTDAEFRRTSGPSGGGGRAGQNRSSSALVENQKNIIAATWKLLNRKNSMPRDQFSEEVNIVAASQQNLAQRTQMSLSRLAERFSFADESFDQAVIHLFEAVMQMQRATERLFAEELKEALGPEQAALQAILKAEAQSRRTAIQMARNRGGSGGADPQSREREDLRELFEMEMGRLENRYEMPAAASGSAGAEQEDILRRLRQLAQRQERLNRAQMDAERRRDRMSEAQQRRHLEELRREQEALSRQADALAQRLSRRGGAAGRTRSPSRSLERAVDQMRAAAGSLQRRDAGGAAQSGREALQNLREQEQALQRRRAVARSDRMPKPGPEQIEQAAESAAALLAELESLRREVEALKSAQSEAAQPGKAARRSPPGREEGRAADLNRLREGLGRSRGHARGLLQPWARGQGWAVSARSIHRELTRRQIEDFMNQPDLWRSLLEPARELAFKLRARTEASRLKDSPFTLPQQAPPDRYKSLVETYYRSLSETAEERDREAP